MKKPLEIQEMLHKAQEWVNNEASLYLDLSYEEGVMHALRWALSQENESPIQQDYKESHPDKRFSINQ